MSETQTTSIMDEIAEARTLVAQAIRDTYNQAANAIEVGVDPKYAMRSADNVVRELIVRLSAMPGVVESSASRQPLFTIHPELRAHLQGEGLHKL